MKIRILFNRELSFVMLIVFISTSVFAQKKNWNTKPYPYGNPVITHMYTADASPHVMPDGQVWMVTSVDSQKGGGYSTMHCYHTFSSPDMVHWTDHGEVLNIWDVIGKDKEPPGEDWALWAPDMVYYGGKYYLYFPVRILYTKHGYGEKSRKTGAYIAVAVSDAPDKRFKVINPKIKGTKGIDPAVFIDDDGQKYLYYGNHFGAKLKDDMTEIENPVHMDVSDKHFMEAIWMDKRDGKYYVSYHTHYGKPVDPEKPDDPNRLKSHLDYGIGSSPFGPFKHMGTMNYELGVNVQNGPKYPGRNYAPWRLTQSNHGGIVEFHGKTYLFYHTSALSSWRQDDFKAEGTWTQRSVCIDELKYNPDGTIIPVQQTVDGVNPVNIDQPFEIVLDKNPVNLSRDKSVSSYRNIDLGTGYYYFGLEANKLEKPCKVEIRLDKPEGLLLGTVVIKRNGKAETLLRGANGKHDIFLVLKSENASLGITNPRFFAGSLQ